MDISELVANANGVVMGKNEFIIFVRRIYHLSNSNYAEAARNLGHNSAAVRRVVLGGDSNSLRRILGVKKTNRLKVCFDCTAETQYNVALLRKERGMNGEQLLEDMIGVYFDVMENMPY